MASEKPQDIADDTSSDDDSFSVIERLADAIRIEEDPRLNAEDRERILQVLYEGPRKCQCCFNWVNELPPKLKIVEPQAAPEPSHPLVIRRRLVPSGPRGAMTAIHSIDICHEGVRAVLHDVFKGYDNLMPFVRHLQFKPPFYQFFWRWDRFEKAIEEVEDEYVKTVLIQLRDVVKKELAGAFAVTKELTSHGVITFKYLWTLFPPGEIIYSDADGAPQFFTLLSSGMATPYLGPYSLRCKNVEWGGTNFVLREHSLGVQTFEGTHKIADLRVFPAKYLEDYDAVREQCIERGRKMISLAGIQYKSYRPKDDQGERNGTSKPRPQQFNRRIVLDSSNNAKDPFMSPLVEPEELRLATGLISQTPADLTPPGGHRPLPTDPIPPPGPRHRHHAGHPPGPNYFPPVPLAPRHVPMPAKHKKKSAPQKQSVAWDSESDEDRPRTSQRRKPFYQLNAPPGSSHLSDSEGESEEGFSPTEIYKLSDNQLLLTSAFMHGFCLKEKIWRDFHISRIYDIDWNTAPFESLVLPEGYKDLILSFVESQLKEGDAFDDVINGKGGGLVILLAGETGVGKTLTAESVAEKMQAPLYKMELANVHDIEDSENEDNWDIDSAFRHAERWNAVLLVDECDMYLEARSDSSPKRNRLVAHFLQKLEYYPSLLFLTTNRERVLDPAIYSRIHLTINYPALDPLSRRQIWKNFLAREWESAVGDAELDQLAEIEVNGRRIRNITKTAKIMAKRQKRGITFTDIRQVLRITEGLTIGNAKTAIDRSRIPEFDLAKASSDVKRPSTRVQFEP
ncbi:P-loop containing nucleoside triphosphate hydrolase protein [Thozetella sp. PMI_491]|nr:P-loop containing nucleoside triphosphate hydrolase protein [Thozetella sp. PMI_491]